jgi:Calcineurin-like phosphoesterase
MNIQLLSDLHLEVHPDFRPTPAPHADLLVLAGDIGSYQSGSLLEQRGDTDFGLARFSPHHGWPTPVLFVPGNHEYDGLDWDATHARLRSTCERLGITWLEKTTHILQGRSGPPVRFVGTTLWSDFDALARSDELTVVLRAREKAFRAANYYLRKTGGSRYGEPVLADTVRALALECQAWLNTELHTPFAGPTVVVTHFAPSTDSADPRYGLAPGTAGFCNALDAWLPQAQLWLHGHLHCPIDYVRGGCRVVANPLGYAGKGEQGFFDPLRCITLSA